MCGIGGSIGVGGDLAERGSRLLGALRHRGPDDEGMECPAEGVLLVHTRLAILDLSPAGHQPMRVDWPDGRGSVWVVFNGEIFNFEEIKRELAELGLPCRTRSDTEVILRSYQAWGDAFVDRFRGMFALCLVDTARGEALLVRDRLGIKPLYLHRPAGGGVVFASQVTALLALGEKLVPARVDPASLESYFAQGAVQGYGTIVDGVQMLPPGTIARVDLRSGAELGRWTYWSLPSGPQPEVSREEAVAELHGLLRESMRMRLISDVPVGLFLSGGVDSAAVLALAAEVSGGVVRTLNVGFDVAAFDESEPAAQTAAEFGAHHTSILVRGQDLLDALPRALAAIDQPTIDGTNTFVVSAAAREAGLTVALSGLGADELFGGYASFRDVPRAMTMRRRFRPAPLLAGVVGATSRSRPTAKLAEALRRTPTPLAMYLLRRELLLPAERRSLHPLPAASDRETGIPSDLSRELLRRSAGYDEQNAVSFFELELYMRHMLLRDSDAFSMAAPIELRVPLLDHRLVEAVFRQPGRWKRPDPRPKPLLLDAVGPRIPERAWRSPKRGFTFPWASWFAADGALAPIARDVAHDAECWRSIGVSPEGVTRIWEQCSRGDRRSSPMALLGLVALHHYVHRHRLRAA